MATKAVTLGQKNGNAVDVALPRTSAELVGYENAEAGGVTDVAAALDTLFEGAADVIVAPGGPDNYLEKTPEGLVVRGVQTSTNQIMMGSTTTVIRSSVIPVSTVALVRLDNLTVPPEAFPENDADIADVVVEGEGNAAYTTFVLQPGTYHFGVASTNAQANGSIGRLFKKAKDGWVVAVTGTYVSNGDQQISILIDCHFTIAEETVFAIGLGVGNWNSFEVTIQKFADASLLAPALIQSKGGLFTGVLSDAGPGFFTSEDNFWKSIGFSGVQYSDLVDSQDDIVAPARTSGSLSGFDAFEVKASGIYHCALTTQQTNQTENDVDAQLAVASIPAATGVPVILDIQASPYYGPNGTLFFSIDAHKRFSAGDKIVFLYAPSLGTLEYVNTYIQLFPDTLSHPNQGVSQDAGNIAVVGKDLGVYVSKDAVLAVLPVASDIQAGITMLSNEVDSNVTTKAATPAAVKEAYGKAVAAQNTADAANAAGADWTASKPGIVQRVEALEAKPDPTPESIGALPVGGTAANASKWNGSGLTISSAAPSGGADNDVWLQYI